MSLIGKSPRLEPTLEDGVAADSDYNTYRIQTRGEYEELMTEFEFRCKRSAMINNHEASSYERIVYWTELVAALLGAVSVSTLGMWLLHWQSSVTSLASFAQLGSLGVLGLAIAFIIELLSKGGERIIPSFSKRAEAHIKAGAAWQRLAQKTRSYRIQLDNPKLDISLPSGTIILLNRKKSSATPSSLPSPHFGCLMTLKGSSLLSNTRNSYTYSLWLLKKWMLKMCMKNTLKKVLN
ncbi:unnamed protein product [Lymnaea stagnalis]|uniref:SMODS and SLOG-associating 2TM effector domain-containing protein n=1 Tax=Lymnaea stagnalis TaxID=6523 RepID=A0AAV2HQP1_LYMST